MNIIGIDVGARFSIVYDLTTGKHFRIEDMTKDLEKLPSKPCKVFLEQTGRYGLALAFRLKDLGHEVYFIDGRAFHHYRESKRKKKNDYEDARLIAKFGRDELEEENGGIYPVEPEMINLRVLVKRHERLNKELTRSINRFKQNLCVIFGNGYHTLSRQKLLKRLSEIEEFLNLEHELENRYYAFVEEAIFELKRIRLVKEEIERIEKQIKEIIKRHPDYEILASVPHMSDIAIANFIASYWDINRFPNIKKFKSYMGVGRRKDKSGTSVRKERKDKINKDVRRIGFMIFLQIHRKTSPLHSFLENRLLPGKKHLIKYIKFLDRFLSSIYYCLKNREYFNPSLFNHAGVDIKKALPCDHADNIVGGQRGINAKKERENEANRGRYCQKAERLLSEQNTSRAERNSEDNVQNHQEICPPGQR
jgi:transposase